MEVVGVDHGWSGMKTVSQVRELKVENDNFYLLTLAAFVKELNRRGMRNTDILLTVGLSLIHFGAEKENRR